MECQNNLSKALGGGGMIEFDKVVNLYKKIILVTCTKIGH